MMSREGQKKVGGSELCRPDETLSPEKFSVLTQMSRANIKEMRGFPHKTSPSVMCSGAVPAELPAPPCLTSSSDTGLMRTSPS